MSPPAVVILDAPVRPALAEPLGVEGAQRLRAALLARTRRWADAAGASRLDVIEAASELAVPAVEAAAGSGPVFVVTTDVPRLGPEHAAHALSDLENGADVVYGSALDGGWYLLALIEPRPELLALDTDGGGSVLSRALETAAQLGLEFGLLRHERRLATPQDLAAMLADPLFPADIRAALRESD